MGGFLIDTGLIDNNNAVRKFLEKNNIFTVYDLYKYDVDYIEDLYIKNQLRGIKDLITYNYSYKPLPFDTFLNSLITYKYNDNAYLTVDFGTIDLNRMGISFLEQLDLKKWAKILYNQNETREITLIELMKSYVEHEKETSLAKKLSIFIEYYDKDKEIVNGNNEMTKFYYLKNKLDVIHQKIDDTENKVNDVKGDLDESRRTY